MAAKIGGILIDVAADVSKLVDGMTKAQQVVEKRTAVMKKALGAMTGVIAAVGGTATIKSLIDAADNAGNVSEALGIATEQWTKYTYTAKFAGVETNTLQAAFGAMIRRTNNFARSGGGAAKTALEELGISAEFARENFTSADKTFEIIIDRLGQVEDGTRKTALAQDIFSKSASSVVRYANLGADEIQRLGDEAYRTGNIISSELASDAGEVNKMLDIMGTRATGLGNKLLVKLTPAILTATKALEDMLDIQRQQSSFEIKREIESITKELESLDDRAKNMTLMQKKTLGIESAYTQLYSKRERIKKQLQEVIKLEELEGISREKNQKTITLPEFKVLKNPEIENQKKEFEKLIEDKKVIHDNFINSYNESTLSKFDYERKKLEEQKSEYIKNGEEKLKIEEWYLSKSKEITDEEAEHFKVKMIEKRESSNSFIFGMEDAMSEYHKNATNSYEVSKDFFTSTMDGMTSSVLDFATEGEKAIKRFAISTLRNFAEIQAQKALAGIAGNLIGAFSGGNWTSGSHVTSGAMAYANGGVFNKGYDMAFANGGVVERATKFPMADGKTGLMGEAGPEAIMPLTRIGSTLGVVSTPSNVEVKVINNGMPLDITKQFTENKTNERGEQKKVVTLFLDAVHRNAFGAKTGLRSAMQ